MILSVLQDLGHGTRIKSYFWVDEFLAKEGKRLFNNFLLGLFPLDK